MQPSAIFWRALEIVGLGVEVAILVLIIHEVRLAKDGINQNKDQLDLLGKMNTNAIQQAQSLNSMLGQQQKTVGTLARRN